MLSQKYDIKLSAGTDTHCLDESESRDLLQKSKKIFFEEESGFDLTFKTLNELVKAFAAKVINLFILIVISLRIATLPFPAVFAGVGYRLFGLPAEFLECFVAGCVATSDVAGAAWLYGVGDFFADGFFKGCD